MDKIRGGASHSNEGTRPPPIRFSGAHQQRLAAPPPEHFTSWKVVRSTDREIVRRYDGICREAPKFNVQRVIDPRGSLALLRESESLDLPIPIFKLDDNSVGPLPYLEISIFGLNDNVNEHFLGDMCRKFGAVSETMIYRHPRTQKHLGMAFVMFEERDAAISFVSKYDSSSVMGSKIHCFNDPFASAVSRRYEKETMETAPALRHLQKIDQYRLEEFRRKQLRLDSPIATKPDEPSCSRADSTEPFIEADVCDSRAQSRMRFTPVEYERAVTPSTPLLLNALPKTPPDVKASSSITPSLVTPPAPPAFVDAPPVMRHPALRPPPPLLPPPPTFPPVLRGPSPAPFPPAFPISNSVATRPMVRCRPPFVPSLSTGIRPIPDFSRPPPPAVLPPCFTMPPPDVRLRCFPPPPPPPEPGVVSVGLSTASSLSAGPSVPPPPPFTAPPPEPPPTIASFSLGVASTSSACEPVPADPIISKVIKEELDRTLAKSESRNRKRRASRKHKATKEESATSESVDNDSWPRNRKRQHSQSSSSSEFSSSDGETLSGEEEGNRSRGFPHEMRHTKLRVDGHRERKHHRRHHRHHEAVVEKRKYYKSGSKIISEKVVIRTLADSKKERKEASGTRLYDSPELLQEEEHYKRIRRYATHHNETSRLSPERHTGRSESAEAGDADLPDLESVSSDDDDRPRPFSRRSNSSVSQRSESPPVVREKRDNRNEIGLGVTTKALRHEQSRAASCKDNRATPRKRPRRSDGIARRRLRESVSEGEDGGYRWSSSTPSEESQSDLDESSGKRSRKRSRYRSPSPPRRDGGMSRLHKGRRSPLDLKVEDISSSEYSGEKTLARKKNKLFTKSQSSGSLPSGDRSSSVKTLSSPSFNSVPGLAVPSPSTPTFNTRSSFEQRLETLFSRSTSFHGLNDTSQKGSPQSSLPVELLRSRLTPGIPSRSPSRLDCFADQNPCSSSSSSSMTKNDSVGGDTPVVSRCRFVTDFADSESPIGVDVMTLMDDDVIEKLEEQKEHFKLLSEQKERERLEAEREKAEKERLEEEKRLAEMRKIEEEKLEEARRLAEMQRIEEEKRRELERNKAIRDLYVHSAFERIFTDLSIVLRKDASKKIEVMMFSIVEDYCTKKEKQNSAMSMELKGSTNNYMEAKITPIKCGLTPNKWTVTQSSKNSISEMMRQVDAQSKAEMSAAVGQDGAHIYDTGFLFQGLGIGNVLRNMPSFKKKIPKSPSPVFRRRSSDSECSSSSRDERRSRSRNRFSRSKSRSSSSGKDSDRYESKSRTPGTRGSSTANDRLLSRSSSHSSAQKRRMRRGSLETLESSSESSIPSRATSAERASSQEEEPEDEAAAIISESESESGNEDEDETNLSIERREEKENKPEKSSDEKENEESLMRAPTPGFDLPSADSRNERPNSSASDTLMSVMKVSNYKPVNDHCYFAEEILKSGAVTVEASATEGSEEARKLGQPATISDAALAANSVSADASSDGLVALGKVPVADSQPKKRRSRKNELGALLDDYYIRPPAAIDEEDEQLQPEVIWPKRTEKEIEKILYRYLEVGLDKEDMGYMEKTFYELVNEGTAKWDREIYWVPVNIPDIKVFDEARRLGKGKGENYFNDPELAGIKPHASGCARAEGYYKLTNREKRGLVRRLEGYQDKTEISERDETTVRHLTQATREARSMNRRILTSIGETQSDFFKVNQLKYRKKMIKFARSRIHGWGLYALEMIAPDEMIVEYVGQKIRPIVADEREKQYVRRGMGSSYLFRIDADNVIDATKMGNFARFINHSCQPNCYAKVVTVDGEKRIVIYSKTQIQKSEEITYDYKFPIEDEKIDCLCGAPTCRGSLN